MSIIVLRSSWASSPHPRHRQKLNQFPHWISRCRWCLRICAVHIISYHIIVNALHFILSHHKCTCLSFGVGCSSNLHLFVFIYTAHGCILPTAPNNGRLVSKTDDSVKFLCDLSYVFPDTILGSRTLYCTERNTWDNSLPNCVGMLVMIWSSLIECVDYFKRCSFLILPNFRSFQLLYLKTVLPYWSLLYFLWVRSITFPLQAWGQWLHFT